MNLRINRFGLIIKRCEAGKAGGTTHLAVGVSTCTGDEVLNVEQSEYSVFCREVESDAWRSPLSIRKMASRKSSITPHESQAGAMARTFEKSMQNMSLVQYSSKKDESASRTASVRNLEFLG